MTPYRNVRYWASDFRNNGHPTTKDESFNKAHAKLRNKIECAFGVLKSRFPILKNMKPYPFPTQRNIVIACVAIHNYLRRTIGTDYYFEQFVDVDAIEENFEQEETIPEQAIGGGSQVDQLFMLNLREHIANQLFNSGV